MSSGVQRTMHGSFMGTGAELTLATVGFRPRVVKLYNRTNNNSLEFWDGMPDGSGKKTVAAGTTTFITTQGITPTAIGFVLGTDAVNSAAGIIHYTATE